MGIAGQKLMSFLLATTALSDIVHAVTATFADLLLSGETEGFAIDATGVTASPAYVGAPEAGYVSIIEVDSPAALMSNLPLDDPRSPLVQSGTSPKLVRYHSDNGDSPGSDYPLLRWTPHNIAIRSEEFDNAAWTKSHSTVSANSTTAPDGTSTADTIIEASDINQIHKILNLTGLTTVAGFTYTVSYYIKAASGSRRAVLNINDGVNGVYAVFDIPGGQVGVTATAYGAGYTAVSSTITSVGSGWYRCALTGIVAGTSQKIDINLDQGTGTAALDQTYSGNGTSGLYIWGAQFNRGPIATPYLVTTSAARIGIPQEYDTAASKYGILVEPAATNIVLNSEDFTAGTAWTNSDTTDAANQTIAPDGASTADSIIEQATTNPHYITTASTSVTSGTVYTESVFLKKGDGATAPDWVQLTFGSGGFGTTVWANYNLTTGVIGSNIGAGATASIVSVGDGWYRCVLTGTATANASTGVLIIAFTQNADTASRLPSYAGAVTANLFAWGGQTETGSVATSYIPTLGSTVTRAADAINVATSAYPHSATNGTMVAWVKFRLTNNATANRVFELNDTTNSEQMNIFMVTADTPDSFGLSVTDGGVVQVIGSGATQTGSLSASGNKVATSWAVNDFSILADAGTEVNDAAGTLPTVTTLNVGYSSTTASRELNGYIYQLTYLPRTMTQAEMQTATT